MYYTNSDGNVFELANGIEILENLLQYKMKGVGTVVRPTWKRYSLCLQERSKKRKDKLSPRVRVPTLERG